MWSFAVYHKKYTASCYLVEYANSDGKKKTIAYMLSVTGYQPDKTVGGLQDRKTGSPFTT